MKTEARARRATTPMAYRFLTAFLAAILLVPFVGAAGPTTAVGPADTARIRSAAEGGSPFSTEVGSRGVMNVRELAARRPTESPSGGDVPLLRRPVPSEPGPSMPGPLQYAGPPPVQATITANPAVAQPGFAGLAYAVGTPTGVEPPDPWVAVGPNHVVQAVNRSLRFTDRSGGSAVTISLGDFFGTSQLPVTTFNADPRVIYDSLHGRWIVTELSWDCASGGGASFGNGYIDVAISQTSDPTGSWSGFYFHFPDFLPDYPALGTSTDKVALTSNVFGMVAGPNCISVASPYYGVSILVLDWTAILNITTLPYDDYFGLAADGYFTARAAVQTPATSAPLRLVVQQDIAGEVGVVYLSITGLVGGGGTALFEVNLTEQDVMQDFTDPTAPRQPGGTIADAVDSRPTDAIWQNNLLTFVTTQACTPSGDSEPRDCVRVAQLDTSTAEPTLAQDFLIAETGKDSYMGGVGMSLNGGLFVVWTRSSATAGDYPSSYGAYQLPSDAPNSISPPELLAAGQATYVGSRWGDYVGVAFDPVERNAVWQANQFASSNGAWATLVSQLKTAAEDATFVPLTPARLLDTRFGIGLSGKFQRDVPRTFQVTGVDGVPLTATAVTGNLTVTASTAPGYVFLGPDALVDPPSSTINFPVGDNRANGVTVALSLTGTLSATYKGPTAGSSTHLIFDVTGYFVN